MQDHDAPGWANVFFFICFIFYFRPEHERYAELLYSLFASLLFAKINPENQRNFEWTLNYLNLRTI